MLPNIKDPTIRLFLNRRLFPPMLTVVLLFSLLVIQVQAKTYENAVLISPIVSQDEEKNVAPEEARKNVSESVVIKEVSQVNSAVKKLLAEIGIESDKQEVLSKECQISGVFTAEVQRWNDEICGWSKEHQMDPDLIATLMQIESCGNKDATSSTGVRGLFQVTGANLDGENPWDPNVSMAKGPGKVFKNSLDAAEGDVRAAFAGYNGGGLAREYVAGKITKNEFYWGLRRNRSGYWPTPAKARAKINEVEWYAKWANIYFDAKGERTDTLQEWLELGGHRLCPSINM